MQHRPRRFAVDRACELGRRRARTIGDADTVLGGRLAPRRGARPARGRHRRGRAGRARRTRPPRDRDGGRGPARSWGPRPAAARTGGPDHRRRASAGPTRAPARRRPRGGVARVRTILVALIGTVVIATSARAARRFAVADRLPARAPGRSARGLPPAIERHVRVALDTAALEVSVTHALEYWTIGIAVAAILGAALGGAATACAGAVLVAAASRSAV